MTEFRGTLLSVDGLLSIGDVIGRYEWIDQLTPEPRVRGLILAPHVEGRHSRYRTLPEDVMNPYLAFGINYSFKARRCRLRIPGVGISPVKLYSPGNWADVSFEAWSPPVYPTDPQEITEALWTAIYDLCHEAGQPDLAGLARAACVLIQGFQPDPSRPRNPRP